MYTAFQGRETGARREKGQHEGAMVREGRERTNQ
jgi:hypothetical protein